ncbi:Protogenin Protein [Collichthys lucidus]|uniref:Protogenin Protein n=1 Tax=Collichthys lucidus TaxID=240159 RepID=A0A4U5U754_COLLU|nr:Protogenin Protein [Collichthys lucidus]
MSFPGDFARRFNPLDPRKKYHVKLLAYNFVGDGYQADQTISTPGCVSVRDRLVPPPPPPHNVYTKTNSSTAVFLHWGRPAFTSSHAINYTVRCNPVGLQNASLVVYLQTNEQSLLVQDLEPNTKYEFAIRLHLDQLPSPWSPVVYQTTFPEAPTLPPSNVKVTVIEEDTALVSWKPPEEPNVAVTHYTILYATRHAWIAGEWQVLQREGTITMALLENLKPGHIYFVKVSASNNMGDGPFSHTVELTVRADLSSGHDPRLSRGSTHSTAFSDGFYHLDQKSMTGITVGVCIALICIIICAFIIVCRGKNRKFSAVKTYREGVSTSASAAAHLGSEGQAENADVTVPMMGQNHFIDAKPITEKKEKWFSFSSNVRKDNKAVQNIRHATTSYQPGTTVLTFEEELSMSISTEQPNTMQALLWRPSDTEGSSNSEGSHATGDSGRYSHDETEMTNLSSGPSSRPPSLTAEDSSGSDCGGPAEEPGELLKETECVEETVADSLDDTLGEQTIDETLYASEVGHNTTGKQHVTPLSSSDHSDIVTLGDLKENDHVEVEEEAAVNEEFYLGTSCSSQYAFTAAETVFPVQQSAVTNSSSSEDEAGRSGSTVVRRRRLRKNATNIVTDPEEEEEEEVLESGQSDEEEEGDAQQEEQAGVRPATAAAPGVRMQGQGSSILNKCILIALVVAISMGFGHFHGTVQIQERQKTVDKIRVNELDGVRDLLHRHVGGQADQVESCDFGLDDLDEQKVISLLTELIKKMLKENQELNMETASVQAQKDDLEMLLKRQAEERSNIVSQQQMLTAENQLLKSSLEQEEKSLSTLQEELRNLRSQIRDLEAMGTGADSLMSENQGLKEKLEEEKQLIRSFHSQREDMVAEAQTLKKKLDRERKVTDEVRRELNLLRSHIPRAGKEAGSEGEELQSRLMELEQRLSFEQQRSDLWERLYVETKEERAKGDTEPKVKKPKEGVAGKVKETFDAVKNSTKEFVHHHKEQIKKAKEAVKENLRKFSDSVKLTFRNFKDSASTFINKARGFYDKRRDDKNSKESWQHRSNRPHNKQWNKFDQSNHNTRKSGGKVHEDRGQNTHKSNLKGCSGVFDCAYQESMSLFNKAMEPIRADEFNQLLQSYLQQEVDHFHHWKDLEMFINNFFHNGVFIHDRMLFTDFVSGVEDYLTDMHEYHGLDDDVFEDLDDYVYRHFFGESYTKNHGPT